MKQLVLGLSILGIVGVSTMTPAAVSAETVSVSQQITITAQVLPARYVIIDANSKILRIISNTTLSELEPQVYESAIKDENRRPLTLQLNQQTKALLKGTTITPGVLYDSTLEPVVRLKPEKAISKQAYTLHKLLGYNGLF